ncbi:MAG: xylulokinase, partial [Bacillota bacterium]
MDYFLGFDIGTSGTKVLLISAEGRIVNTVISSYDIKSSHTDWAEQEPSTWWQALKKCINKLNNSFTPELKKVKAIGLSGQMHGAVFMDKKGEPVYPCILWADNRSEKECREIKEKAGQEEIYQITGNPVIPAYTAPKILWFKKNKRKLYEKTDIILMAKDYIGFKLTGNYFTDYSDASGTLLFNIRKKRWSEKIFQELKLDINRHPEIISSLSKAGNLTGKAAQELGLKQGIPVIAGAGDLACGAIGSNNIKEGTATITIGTAGQVVASLNKVPETVTGEVFYFCHGLKNKYFSLASLLSGGLCLKWFKNNISKIENIIEKETGKDAFNILISGIENISPGADGLFFLPYLNGAG